MNNSSCLSVCTAAAPCCNYFNVRRDKPYGALALAKVAGRAVSRKPTKADPGGRQNGAKPGKICRAAAVMLVLKGK